MLPSDGATGSKTTKGSKSYGSPAPSSPAPAPASPSYGTTNTVAPPTAGTTQPSTQAIAELLAPEVPSYRPELILEEMMPSKREQREERQADRNEARADRILERMGIEPMVNTVMPVGVGQFATVPNGNPAWVSAREEILARLERKDDLGLGGGKGKRPEPGKDKQREKPERGEVEPMTWAEYNALSPEARAAVDYNTMLVQAVRTDRRKADTYDPTKEQQRTYDLAVQDMFGADGGSKKFAPETLAMLQQIEFSDQAGDLDDFLRLRTAVTEKDMKAITTNDDVVYAAEANMAGPAETPREERTEYLENLVDATEQLQVQLARGNALLQDWRTTAIAARQPGLSVFGGANRNVKQGPAGFGPAAGFDENGQLVDPYADQNTYFQVAFDKLAQTKNEAQVNKILSDVQGGIPAEDYPKFIEYLDIRSRMAQNYDGVLGQGKEYTQPEKFRQLLGLDR